jgi:hypothetical protein
MSIFHCFKGSVEVEVHVTLHNMLIVTRCYRKVSALLLLLTASVKEDDRGGQSPTYASLLHQSTKWHRAVNTHCFYESAFSTLCFVLSAMDGKIRQCVCIKFCVKLSKSTTRTLEILRNAFGEHSLSQTVVFEWHSHPWARRHRWDQLWCLPGDLKRKFEHAPHCHKVCSPTLDKWSKAAACKRVPWAMRES